MDLKVEHLEDVAVVIPDGMLAGEPETDELQRKLEELLDGGHKKILLNLSKTPFMTSRAFGVIILTQTSAMRRKATFYTCGMQERVQKVIQIIRVTGWPKRFDDCKEALDALAQR